MRLFDRKFGPEFLAGVPAAPGVYRLYDPEGALLYVGKARDLRRRLGQYRTARRVKRDRKRRALVRSAERIEWEVRDTELDASLAEIELIQTLRPPKNIAGAYSFLYPFVGVRASGGEMHVCLTTAPEAFPAFDFHGAYGSRLVTREAAERMWRAARARFAQDETALGGWVLALEMRLETEMSAISAAESLLLAEIDAIEASGPDPDSPVGRQDAFLRRRFPRPAETRPR